MPLTSQQRVLRSQQLLKCFLGSRNPIMVFMMFKAIHIELICLAIISALYFLVFALIVPLYKWHLTRFRPHVLSESHWVKRLEHHNMLLVQLIVLFLVPTLLLSLFDILGTYL